MVVHAAFGGSTNLLLHIPAIAHAAKCQIPSLEDWHHINKKNSSSCECVTKWSYSTPNHTCFFLAGGVPEVMLHLRNLGLLREHVMTVTGHTLSENLDWWEQSERRQKMKEKLKEEDQIDADEVIMSKEKAIERGLTSTVTFPTGNLAPEGAVIKSTSIDSSRLDKNKVYYHKSEAKVFTSEANAIEAIKTQQIKKKAISWF